MQWVGVFIRMCYLHALGNTSKPEHPAIKLASLRCKFFHSNAEVDGLSGANQYSVLQFW